ncbi:hypothetical protein L2735_10395 [Shewanella olleyana]|uniref:hypothetical protein n=1 Tax=Shewanella olleyana TaxID=135626 RepID=UPI00200F21F3|nr:hypothetical protein [Shewanella olleyana]MCL1067216.1 hypothetical protein [Shewanella olleyana]
MGLFSSGTRDSPTIFWETLKNKGENGSSQFTYRAKVPGGWLISSASANHGIGLTFIPDPNHDWDGNSI